MIGAQHCPECGSKMSVTDTVHGGDQTFRKLECGCGERWESVEVRRRKLPANTHMRGPNTRPRGQAGISGRSELSSSLGSSLSLLPSADQDQTPARVERVIETFPVVGNEGEAWGLTESIHAELVKAYPGVDASAEYAKIKFWANSNPTKRKTPRGMPAFLQRWFEKAQNRVAAAPRPASAVPPWKQAERDEEARKREAANQEIRARREIQARLDAAGRSAG